jgi:hypothetical protein
VYKQILINETLRIGKKRGQKTELTGRTLKRGRPALDCSAVDEEEEEEDFKHQLIKIQGVIWAKA